MLSGEEISHPSVYLVFLNGELDFLFMESVNLFFSLSNNFFTSTSPIFTFLDVGFGSEYQSTKTSDFKALFSRDVHGPFTDKANGN